jgi:hypothetical protein
MTRRVVVAFAALTVTGWPGMPGRIAAQERSPQTYSTAATAILVDVVVRDHKGRPMTDLAADEFELYEDGVPQKVDTFGRLHHCSRSSGQSAASGKRQRRSRPGDHRTCVRSLDG